MLEKQVEAWGGGVDFAGVEPKIWLTFSVLAAVISTLGTLLGIFLRDWLLAGSAERRAERRTIRKLIRDSSEPLILAGDDLVRRLEEINENYPPDYFVRRPTDAGGLIREKTAAIDPHFNRYKVRSTLYRFAAFLGWIECFRSQLSFVELAQSDFAKAFGKQLHQVTRWMSDGTLSPNWETDRDCLIYREEIRAIGESMLIAHRDGFRVMGYAQFYAEMDASGRVATWVGVLDQFLGNLRSENDFRKTRLVKLQDQIEGMCDMLREYQAKTR